MSPEAQRIAIAEACGWTRVPNARGRRWCRHYLCLGPHHSLGSLPDYLNDLNAMHEAENVISESLRATFTSWLCLGEINRHWAQVHATAAQRAEAFLRTISRWDDSK